MSDKEYAVRRLAAIRERIDVASQSAGRANDEITLVGAAKQQSPQRLADFIAAGLKDLGENYLQEALSAQQQLIDRTVHWHYIGQIQSNKTSTIAENFSWVHSVDRLKIAQRLARQRTADTAQNILLQVNVDNEDSKAGVSPKDAVDLCKQVCELENLNLRGLMVLPRATRTLDQQREPFARARELLALCNQSAGLSMDTLSMGMSGDLEAAILEGSTMVRIGTDLFGARE